MQSSTGWYLTCMEFFVLFSYIYIYIYIYIYSDPGLFGANIFNYQLRTIFVQ